MTQNHVICQAYRQPIAKLFIYVWKVEENFTFCQAMVWFFDSFTNPNRAHNKNKNKSFEKLLVGGGWVVHLGDSISSCRPKTVLGPGPDLDGDQDPNLTKLFTNMRRRNIMQLFFY